MDALAANPLQLDLVDVPPIVEAPPVQPNDFQNAVSRIAFAALRYTALSVIAIASAYYLGQGFLGRVVIVLLGGGIAIGLGFYAVSSIQSITRGEVPVNEIARKADLIARVLLWSLCVIGALSVGLAGGYFISGISFLITGAQTGGFLPILNGLVDLTFTLGFAIPLAKLLMRQSNFLYEGYEHLRSRLAQTIEDFRQNPVQGGGNILGRLGLFFGNNLNFDALLDVAEHIPEETLRNQFVANLPVMTDERIRQVINRFPNTFTIEFLAQNMSEEKFRAIVAPMLRPPLTLTQIEEIDAEITAKTDQLTNLENRLAKNDNRNELQGEAEQISTIISGYINMIAALRNFIQRLPANNLPAHLEDLQPAINAARNLVNRAQEVQQRLNAEDNDSFRTRLQRFLSQVAPQDQEDDSEDSNYDVLGALGFTLADFRTLGNRLGIPADELYNHEIERTSRFLNDHGLGTRGQLNAHRLLGNNGPRSNSPSSAAAEGNLDDPEIERSSSLFFNAQASVNGSPSKEQIMDRIVNYCIHGAPNEPKPVVAVVNAAPAAGNEGAIIEGVVAAPLADAAPIAAAAGHSGSHWARVARVANNIFHVVLSGSLMTIQFAYQPVSTSVGFIYGLINNDNSAGRLGRLWSASPDYINQGFTERMQDLYRCISTVTWAIWLGPVGGIFAGLRHADAVLYYGRHIRDRINRLLV